MIDLKKPVVVVGQNPRNDYSIEFTEDGEFMVDFGAGRVEIYPHVLIELLKSNITLANILSAVASDYEVEV